MDFISFCIKKFSPPLNDENRIVLKRYVIYENSLKSKNMYGASVRLNGGVFDLLMDAPNLTLVKNKKYNYWPWFYLVFIFYYSYFIIFFVDFFCLILFSLENFVWWIFRCFLFIYILWFIQASESVLKLCEDWFEGWNFVPFCISSLVVFYFYFNLNMEI